MRAVACRTGRRRGGTARSGGGLRAGRGCLTADPPPLDEPAQPLRFGIDPAARPAPSAAPRARSRREDPAAARDALEALQPPRRTLVVRLNRLFMSDGAPGSAASRGSHGATRAPGFEVESQVRYHPHRAQEGDMRGLEAVRAPGDDGARRATRRSSR